MRTSLRAVLTAAVLLVAVGAGASAWACVPQPMIASVQPRSSAAPGEQVTVVGENFPGSPVEIRWNGLQGPLLGTGNGPSFSIAVTVPDEVPGLYLLTALSRQPGGQVGDTARASFQVQGAAGEAAAAPAAQPSPPAAEPGRTGVLVGGAVGVFAAGALAVLLFTRLRRPSG